MKMRHAGLSLVQICCVLCGLGAAVRAELKLPALLSDHAVFQQGLPIPVWGWADPGEQVTVEFRKQKVTTRTPASGRWMVRLKPEKAGGPDALKVTGKKTLTASDVQVGEVWLASGQSNMEFPLNRSFEAAADIAASSNSLIRHFEVPRVKADQPLTDVRGYWELASPDASQNFSAVAYYFSRDLQKALQVPVGIIHASWGGSPAEVWMNESVITANPEYKNDILGRYEEQRKRYVELATRWQHDRTNALRTRQPVPPRPLAPWRPAELYNGMIVPLIPYALRGVIWYQGEANAGRAAQYRTLYPDLIQNWRKDWDLSDLTFLGVQLAPFDHGRKRSLEEITAAPTSSAWAELREAQVLSTQTLKNCGLAVITDVGDKDDIHPVRKAPVGARLALQARRIAYGEKIVASGPTYKSMKLKDGQLVVSFENVGSGLQVRGEQLTGFALCGEDRHFVWAKAEIDGDKVVLSSPQVAKPIAARYGWADFPVVNLFNREGLPASPFRTDDFPLITAPKPAAAK
jgi:sialate O-acetylesterase